MNIKNNTIIRINSIYFKIMFSYSLFVLIWVFFVGSSITFSNYRTNLSYPLTYELIMPWKILRDIGLFLALPSWLVSIVILIISIKSKNIIKGIFVCVKWFLVYLLLILFYAIAYGFIYFILLMMINKG